MPRQTHATIAVPMPEPVMRSLEAEAARHDSGREKPSFSGEISRRLRTELDQFEVKRPQIVKQPESSRGVRRFATIRADLATELDRLAKDGFTRQDVAYSLIMASAA